MNTPLESFIQSLRDELQQYGEMLARLESQQEQVMTRNSNDILQTSDAVQEQGRVIEATRREREQAQRTLAAALQHPGTATLAEIIPLLPAPYQPLTHALVNENNQLLQRIHHRARQNHLLLNRSLELLQRFINTLCPSNTPVYTGRGGLSAVLPTPFSLYEAVG